MLMYGGLDAFMIRFVNLFPTHPLQSYWNSSQMIRYVILAGLKRVLRKLVKLAFHRNSGRESAKWNILRKMKVGC